MENVEMLFFELLKKEEMQKLCKVVEERIATGLVIPEAKPKNPSFGVSDLWNIRRNTKTAASRWNNKHSALFIR